DGARGAGAARRARFAGPPPGERDVPRAPAGRGAAPLRAGEARDLHRPRRAAGRQARERGPGDRRGRSGPRRGGGVGGRGGRPARKGLARPAHGGRPGRLDGGPRACRRRGGGEGARAFPPRRHAPRPPRLRRRPRGLLPDVHRGRHDRPRGRRRREAGARKTHGRPLAGPDHVPRGRTPRPALPRHLPAGQAQPARGQGALRGQKAGV
ncbi:MAG: Transcriptional regulator, GntR family, partial [uncultured Rubrobacteraceae bacterium]